MDSKKISNVIKRRKTKKKRNKKNITSRCQDKSQETDDVWEIPSDYSSHNSEQITSDYGSTCKYLTKEEKQEQLSLTKKATHKWRNEQLPEGNKRINTQWWERK